MQRGRGWKEEHVACNDLQQAVAVTLLPDGFTVETIAAFACSNACLQTVQTDGCCGPGAAPICLYCVQAGVAPRKGRDRVQREAVRKPGHHMLFAPAGR